MIYLASILVFIASIMTYMFFPRSDSYQIDMYREETNIVTLLNQHQAAKDYMKQMITWTTSDSKFHTFDADNLWKMLPPHLRGDIYGGFHDISTNNSTPDDGFISSLVCLDESENIASCPQNKQYVLTTGYQPDWWPDDSYTWLRSMQKRSYGSTVCGILADVIDGPEVAYAINNGQKHTGFTKHTGTGKSIIYPAVSAQLDSWYYDTTRNVLICMTPYTYPYSGTPVYHWDSVSNKKGAGYESGFGVPLIGSETDVRILCGSAVSCPTAPYTISAGFVPFSVSWKDGKRQTTVISGTATLLNLNNTQNISLTCSSEVCSLTAGTVTVSNIPGTKPFLFNYMVSSEGQNLRVLYNECSGNKCQMKEKKATNTTTSANPVLSEPKISFEPKAVNTNGLLYVRLYGHALDKLELNKNNKTDKKRFGF